MKTHIQKPEIYDCLRTCVANLFDLNRWEVPNFGYAAVKEGFGPQSDEYATLQALEFDEWCVEHGVYPFRLPINDKGKPKPMMPWGLCIACGPAERGFDHAVVWDAKWWHTVDIETYGEMVHDPHPSGAGLLKVDMFICFGVKDPGTIEYKEERK